MKTSSWRARAGISLFIGSCIALVGASNSVAAGSTAVVARISTTKPVRDESENYVADRVIVKFKSVQPIEWTRGIRIASPRLQGQNIVSRLSVSELTALAAVGGTVMKGIERAGILLIKPSVSVGQAVEKLMASGQVVYAEPDYKVSINAVVPNDPLFSNLWGMDNTGQAIGDGGSFGSGTSDADVDAPEVWASKTDTSSVIVGVIDTGVDYTHEDLAANMWTNPSEIPGNGIDDDGNGYVDDVYGIDTFNDDSDPIDDHYHGTHVSGTIGAVGNNGIGVVGLGWKAKIMALKFLSSSGWGSDYDAITAIYYALDIKAANGYPRMVLSNSWGGCCSNSSLQQAISDANLAGVMFVAAAGNNAQNLDENPFYPASYNLPNMIVVGASDFKDQPASFSNFGCGSVHVFAPGVNVLSTVPGNGYGYLSGTSMATPHVSGIAAMVWARYPTRTLPDIKAGILSLTNAKSSLKGLAVTGGRVVATSYVVSRPTVFGISPSMAQAGSQITITGTRFGASAGSVTIDGVAATIQTWNNVQIVATLDPSTVAGTHKLTVTTSGNVASLAGGCVRSVYGESLAGHLLFPRGYATSAQVNNDVYVIGGQMNWGTSGIVEKYTLDTGHSSIDSNWTMPVPVANAGSAISSTGKLYVVGGQDSYNYPGTHDTLQVLDTCTMTWTLGASMPSPRYQSAVALANGKVYVFGGLDQFGWATNTTFIYNIAKNTWSTGAPLPTNLTNARAINRGTSGIWVIGGATYPYSGYEVRDVIAYDPTAGTWSDKPDLTSPRQGFALVSHTGSRVLAMHGFIATPYNDFRADGEIYANNIWKPVVLGSQGVTSPVGGRVGNDIYTLGGYNPYQNNSSYSDNVWKATVP